MRDDQQQEQEDSMDMDITERAHELLRREDGVAVFPGHPAHDDPEHWAIGPIIETRDSSLIEKTNARALEAALRARPEFEDEWEVHRFGHWAVGWVHHLSLRVLDDAGAPTPVLRFLVEWERKLDGYPVADEEALCEAEYEAAIESIEQSGRRVLRDGAPEDWASEVYRWLGDHEPGQLDDHDGQGPSPSDESVERALVELGFAEDEDEDEVEA